MSRARLTTCAPLSHAANPGRHSLADRQQDLYETPECATRALLAVEAIPIGRGLGAGLRAGRHRPRAARRRP